MSGAWGDPKSAAQWQAAAAMREAVLEPANEVLLRLAGIAPGMRILDVGAGTGQLAVRLARDAKIVLATDASPAMLDVARENAAREGLRNVMTLAVPAEELSFKPASFDAAVSRNCLMFVHDRVAALIAINVALAPNARFACTAWGPLERNPSQAAPIEAVKARCTLPDPPPEVVQAFSLSDPATLRSLLEASGFAQIEVHAVPLRRRFASVAEAVQAQRAAPPIRQLFKVLPEEHHEAAWQDIERAYARYAAADGSVTLPAELLVAGAVSPSSS